MIILFHWLNILISQLLKNRRLIKYFEESETKKPSCEANTPEKNKDIDRVYTFHTPVYIQRHAVVFETLTNERWRKKLSVLVDFGCSKYDMFVVLRRLTNICKLCLVDIDEEILNQYAGKLYFFDEALFKRLDPLLVKVFVGSVSDPDNNLAGTDVVTAVELIEHLYPDVLEGVPYNIFGYIKPKIVIITTPNSDFNVLFSKNATTFRHYDHKFEWSREQFEDWANNIIMRFPNYKVEFTGAGKPPLESEHLGKCSQIAIFFRKDILSEDYRHPENCCACLPHSPCRSCGDDEKGFLCNCVCDLCSPKASLGICTYYSCSYPEWQNPPNRNYKEIININHKVSKRAPSAEERLRDDLSRSVPEKGVINGLYYVKENKRSEIPIEAFIDELYMYSITAKELATLIVKFGYTVEECSIPWRNCLGPCVVYEPPAKTQTLPYLMEANNSEASGYDSDCANYSLNEESLSDWDDPYVKEEKEKDCDNCTDMACLGMTSREQPIATTTDVEEDKKQKDPLFDSGYQKSLSLVDDSPQTPLEELEETDMFEDTTSTPSLTSEDNKVHLKKTHVFEKQNFVPPPAPDFSKFKFDMNRINEMDKFHNISPGRTFFNHFVSPPDGLKKSFLKDKDSLPGPSSSPSKKRRKYRKNLPADCDEDSPFEDVKSITNCLIENTLNKLDVKEEKQNLIEYVEPELAVQQDVVAPPVQDDEVPQVVEEPVAVVENGDLANNNRDVEGNNYIAQEEAVENIGNDIVNDNLEMVMQIPEDNANVDNNNRQDENLRVIEDPLVIVGEAINVENAENAQDAYNLLGDASREALFDPNSEQDSLEDLEIPAPLHDADDVLGVVSTANNIVFIGVHTTPEEHDTDLPEEASFPHWLLQILGSQVVVDGDAPATSQEEPHFYCQGDGLGVHPSVIAVEIDEEEEEDDTTDSSNNTAEFAELNQGPSSQDMSSLPEDSQATNPLDNNETEEVVIPNSTEHQNSTTDVGASGSS